MTTKDIKYWLEEKELKTPKHDEMVLWCFNNPEKILESLGLLQDKPSGFRLTHPSGEEYTQYFDYDKKVPQCYWDWDEGVFFVNEKEFLKKIKKAAKEKAYDLESLQKDYKNLLNLKIEMEEDFKEFKVQVRKRDESKIFYIFNKQIEFSLHQGTWNIGFIDLMINCSFNKVQSDHFAEYFVGSSKRDCNCYLEIKPEVKSIGETMRQVNFYRDYIRHETYHMILVTKTQNLKDIFKSQEVYVFEYGDKKLSDYGKQRGEEGRKES